MYEQKRLLAWMFALVSVTSLPVAARPSTLERDPNAEVPALNPPVLFAPNQEATQQAPSPQVTNTLLMVRPTDFGYNAQTGADNVFEHHGDDPAVVTGQALREFDGMVLKLRGAGITVLVLEPGPHKIKTPDAVFPNNWVTIDHHGSVVVFPMKTPNRRAETGRINDVLTLLRQSGYAVKDRPTYVGDGGHHALEGTGAMVLDHHDKLVYAALSERCNSNLLDAYARTHRYAAPVAFPHARHRRQTVLSHQRHDERRRWLCGHLQRRHRRSQGAQSSAGGPAAHPRGD